MAFFLHCSKYRVPLFHCSDAGSAANFKPGNPAYVKYFGKRTIETLTVEASHQHLNKAERHISEIKKLLKTIFLQRDRLLMPKLSLTAVQALLNTVCVVLNNRPIDINNVGLNLTPNHLLKLWRLSESQSSRVKTPSGLSCHEEYLVESLQNLTLLSEMVGNAHAHLVQILKLMFVTNVSKYRQRGKKFDFRVGDIVLVFKTQDYYLARIVEAGEQFCKVESGYSVSRESKHIHCQKMVLIHREQPVGVTGYKDTS